MGGTVGDKLRDKWKTPGDQVPRLPEPHAYMLKEGGTRHHPLLLEIDTQKLPAAGNKRIIF